jgi:hypothetical protein
VAVAVMLMDPLLEPELEPVIEAEPEPLDPLALPPAPLRPVGCSPGAHVAELGRVMSALEAVLAGVKGKRGRGDIHLADRIGKSQSSYHRWLALSGSEGSATHPSGRPGCTSSTRSRRWRQ